MKEFWENKDGVHLVGRSVQSGGEFTLCGDSFDIAGTESDFEAGELVKTSKSRSMIWLAMPANAATEMGITFASLK